MSLIDFAIPAFKARHRAPAADGDPGCRRQRARDGIGVQQLLECDGDLAGFGVGLEEVRAVPGGEQLVGSDQRARAQREHVDTGGADEQRADIRVPAPVVLATRDGARGGGEGQPDGHKREPDELRDGTSLTAPDRADPWVLPDPPSLHGTLSTPAG
jgi:hypothetical protein